MGIKDKRNQSSISENPENHQKQKHIIYAEQEEMMKYYICPTCKEEINERHRGSDGLVFCPKCVVTFFAHIFNVVDKSFSTEREKQLETMNPKIGGAIYDTKGEILYYV